MSPASGLKQSIKYFNLSKPKLKKCDANLSSQEKRNTINPVKSTSKSVLQGKAVISQVKHSPKNINSTNIETTTAYTKKPRENDNTTSSIQKNHLNQLKEIYKSGKYIYILKNKPACLHDAGTLNLFLKFYIVPSPLSPIPENRKATQHSNNAPKTPTPGGSPLKQTASPNVINLIIDHSSTIKSGLYGDVYKQQVKKLISILIKSYCIYL